MCRAGVLQGPGLLTEGGTRQGTVRMRVSDWLIGKVSRGGQSNSDVPHSGYFEELRVCAFRVACVFLSLLCTAPAHRGSNSDPNKSAIAVNRISVFPRRTCRRSSVMLPLLLLAFVAAVARASDVLEFTDDDFESRIGDHDLILVEFFAPW